MDTAETRRPRRQTETSPAPMRLQITALGAVKLVQPGDDLATIVMDALAATGETLMDEACALAARVAAMPPHALRQAKNLMRQGRSISYDTALELAANTQALMHLTDDHMEGIDALLEKRAPRFEGR